MPKSTPNVKVQRVREYGARVILHGQDFSEAAAEMHRVAQEESLTIIHPFDDAEIIAVKVLSRSKCWKLFLI